MNLGKKLINLRKQEKLTQEKFAEIIGVTRQTVSNWELNSTKPDLTQIEKISKLFHVSIDELLDNDIQNIIVEKVNKTEKIVNKNTKTIKILVITIYFVLLLSSIAIILYYTTKKDFTKPYQTEIICTNKTEKNKITFDGKTIYDEDMFNPDKQNTDTKNYAVIWEFDPKHPHSDKDGYIEGEKYETGDSFADIFNTIQMLKDFYIEMYDMTCR